MPRPATDWHGDEELHEELVPLSRLMSDDHSSMTKRRRLGRRDSDSQVERIIQNKLGHFSAEVIESAVNKNGETIRDYLKRRQKEAHTTSNRLSSRFWCEFYEEFPLKRSLAEALESPSEQEDVGDELLAAMGIAHQDNPASRSVEPLEVFLLHCSTPLNQTEMFGLLRSSMEGHIISRKSSCRILLAILAYMARCRLVACPKCGHGTRSRYSMSSDTVGGVDGIGFNVARAEFG